MVGSEVGSRDHYLRCRAYLATLRLAASPEAAEPISAACADVVRDLTAAIVAEATAAMALTVTTAAGMRQAATAGFLPGRLLRLRLAADDAVTAARASDADAFRQHVRRLEALTLALWTVQAAVSPTPDPASARLPSRSRRGADASSSSSPACRRHRGRTAT